MRNRTLATLLVRDSSTNEDETLLIIIPLPHDQAELLNVFVKNFCERRNMSLLVIPPVSPEFRAWPDRIGYGEFQCEVCKQSYLDPEISVSGNDNARGKYCSNFCRQAASQSADEKPESNQE